MFGMGTGVTSLPSSLDYCRPPIHGVLLRQLLSFNRSRTEVRSLIHSFASLYYLCLETLDERIVLSKLDKRALNVSNILVKSSID